MRQTNIPYDRTAHGQLLTVPKVMELLDCSRSFVYKLIKSRKLKSVRLGEVKGVRVPEKCVVQYIHRKQEDAKKREC